MKRTEAPATLPPLVALKAISNGALQGEELPNRIKLLNWGTNETVKGPVLVDSHSAAVLSANQRQLGYDRIALDYQHNTVPGSPEYERTKEPRDVAAYGVPEIVSGDGLYLKEIQWTGSGRANAKNFADLSPTPALDDQRRVTFLHSVALVRNGAVQDLSFFSAPAEPIDLTNTMNAQELQSAIAEAIKPITDQVTTLAAEVKTLKEAKPAEPVIPLMVDGKETKLSLAEAGAKLIALESGVNGEKTAREKAEKEKVVALFAAEGKVPLGADKKALTVEQLSALPMDQLTILHANTPVTVPLSARGKQPASDKGTEGLKGLDRAIAAHKADRN